MQQPLETASFIKDSLAKIGIEISVEPRPTSQHFPHLMAGKHELGLAGWTTDNSDPDNFLYSLLDIDNISEAGNNVSRYRSDELHRLLQAGQRELDEKKRIEIYHKAQEIIFQDVPVVPLVHCQIQVACALRYVERLQTASDDPSAFTSRVYREFAVIGFVVRRTFQAAATMLVAVVLIFIAVRILPGNPVLSKFGQHVDPAQVAKLKAEQGWDRPIVVQLGDFFWQLLTTGSLGESLARSNESVSEELRHRVPATMELALGRDVHRRPRGGYRRSFGSRATEPLPRLFLHDRFFARR